VFIYIVVLLYCMMRQKS